MPIKPPPIIRPRWYRRPGCLIVLLPVILIAYGIFHDWYEANRPTYYEEAKDFPVDDLPTSARDIRYSPKMPLGPGRRSYEFLCSESDFREWARKWRVTEPKLGPV
jgi:hypothetical protein